MSEYPYPLRDKVGKVICQLCGKPFLVVSPKHLSTKHNIKYNEYKLRFPDAPLSSEAFGNVTKYGKNQTIFVQKEMSKFEEESDLNIDNEQLEEIIVNEEVEIAEEMNLSKILDSKPKNFISNKKNQMLDYLRSYFTNIQKDYSIEQYGPDGLLKFVFITDFCDPISKTVIQFPNTFWHNREQWVIPNKNRRLEQYGWEVIEFKSNCPSFKEIAKRLK